MRPAALFEVQVYDQNDNGAEAETHVDGFLEAAWNALTAFLKAMWEAIKELASAVFDFIWDMISGMMDVVLKPIMNAIENYVDNLKSTILDITGLSEKDMESRGGSAESLYNLMASGNFFNVMFVTYVVLDAISVIIYPFSAGGISGKVFSVVSDQIARAIIGSIVFGSVAAGSILAIDTVLEMIPVKGDDDLWVEGTGLSVLGLLKGFIGIFSISSFAKEEILEVVGFIAAIAGVLLSLLTNGFWWSILGLAISASGWILTLYNKDSSDKLGLVFSSLEEVLGGICFAVGFLDFSDDYLV